NVPGANNTLVSINPLVVSIPTPGDPFGASGAPTGTVFNIDRRAATEFKVSGFDAQGNPAFGSAIFLFATEDGTIVGLNRGVNPEGFDPAKAGPFGIITVDNSGNNFTEPDPALQKGHARRPIVQPRSQGERRQPKPGRVVRRVRCSPARPGLTEGRATTDVRWPRVRGLRLAKAAHPRPRFPTLKA